MLFIIFGKAIIWLKIKKQRTQALKKKYAKLELILNYKLKSRIAKTVMEAEFENKHREKKQSKKDIKQIGLEFNNVLGEILYSSLIYIKLTKQFQEDY